MDKTELKVQGHILTDKGQFLYIDIVKCQGRSDCKSDAEIQEYFAR